MVTECVAGMGLDPFHSAGREGYAEPRWQLSRVGVRTPSLEEHLGKSLIFGGFKVSQTAAKQQPKMVFGWMLW